MKASGLYRIASVLLVLFAAGFSRSLPDCPQTSQVRMDSSSAASAPVALQQRCSLPMAARSRACDGPFKVAQKVALRL
jgi:hypothetical protein